MSARAVHLLLSGRDQAAWDILLSEGCWTSNVAAAAPAKGAESYHRLPSCRAGNPKKHSRSAEATAIRLHAKTIEAITRGAGRVSSIVYTGAVPTPPRSTEPPVAGATKQISPRSNMLLVHLSPRCRQALPFGRQACGPALRGWRLGATCTGRRVTCWPPGTLRRR